MKSSKINVKQSLEAEVPTDVLADSIVAISQGIRKLRAGKLNDRALILLIQDAAPKLGGFRSKPISQKDIKSVFAGIEGLEAAFIRKPDKAKAK